MKEYQITLTVKNNLLLTKMRAAGIKSVTELARISRISTRYLCEISNLKLSLHDCTGNVRKPYLKLAELFNCLPEELVPVSHHDRAFRSNSMSIECNAEELRLDDVSRMPALQNMAKDFEDKELVSILLKSLTPRQEEVIRCRFLENQTLEEIAQRHKVTRERIRIIEVNALRHMRARMRQIREHDEITLMVGKGD